jgi:LytS/YehU family sensor histidine kinase
LFWIVWAALAPRVVTLAHRWPLHEPPIGRRIGRHVATSLALAAAGALVAFALHFVALWGVGRVPGSAFVAWMMRVRASLVWGEFMGVLFYWMVVGAITALRFRDLYAAERVSAAELAAHSATLEGQLARAQLDALRSQLRPHFLFNTLNAISVLTLEDASRARHMVVRLGSLLRRSLDEEEHEVPLRQELVFLDDYLDIQRARFGDRLVVTLDVDAGAAEARVPVLLLQPLVENAIEHGWPEKDATTTIALHAARTDGVLRLSVEDNGPGAGDSRQLREGIGLSNTRERLRRLYGDRAAMRLGAARPDDTPAGTRVEITIPFSTASA